jgi:hypothetical protein
MSQTTITFPFPLNEIEKMNKIKNLFFSFNFSKTFFATFSHLVQKGFEPSMSDIDCLPILVLFFRTGQDF